MSERLFEPGYWVDDSGIAWAIDALGDEQLLRAIQDLEEERYLLQTDFDAVWAAYERDHGWEGRGPLAEDEPIVPDLGGGDAPASTEEETAAEDHLSGKLVELLVEARRRGLKPSFEAEEPQRYRASSPEPVIPLETLATLLRVPASQIEAWAQVGLVNIVRSGKIPGVRVPGLTPADIRHLKRRASQDQLT